MQSYSDDALIISFPDLTHREASVLAREMQQELESDLLEAGEQDFDIRVYRENPTDQSLGASLLLGGAGVILSKILWGTAEGIAGDLGNRLGQRLVGKIETLLKKYNTRGKIRISDSQEVTLGTEPDNKIKRMTELNGLGVVILGASEYPYMPDDRLDNPNLQRSAEAVKKLFSTHPPHSVFQKVEILDLFNADIRVDGIVDHIEQMVKENPDINDLIFYYCGHGTYFGNNDQKYCLLLKNNIKKREMLTSIVIEDFQYLIDASNFFNKRIYFIIDACHAGAASEIFQDVRPIHAIKQQIDKLFVAKGRAILAAANKEKAAVGEDGNGLTMFTGALKAVLSCEAGLPNCYLSLEDLHKEITDYIRIKYNRRDGVIPECYTPGNIWGHISRTPIFMTGDIRQIAPEFESDPNEGEERQKKAEKQFMLGEAYYFGQVFMRRTP